MNEIELEQAEYELKVEHYLSLYQLTKCKDSADDIQCQIEALKQYLEERIMCDVMCDGDES